MTLLKTLIATLLLALAGTGIAGELIDINSADAKVLEELNGVGPAKAAAIVAYREANGPFETVEELANVKGIGLKTVELNRASLTTGGSPAATATAQGASGDMH